jgi:hypothetical protein
VKVVSDVFLEPGPEIGAGVRPFEGEREEVFLVRCLGSGFRSRSIVRWRSEIEIGLSDDLAERRKMARRGWLTMTATEAVSRAFTRKDEGGKLRRVLYIYICLFPA